MKLDTQTIGLIVIFLGLFYMHYQCEQKKRKQLLQKMSLKTQEGFRLPWRCDPYGDFYQMHGIPYDPYRI